MSISLRDLEFKAAYSSSRGDNILEDFYIPALSHSSRYKRIAGFFSSNALAIAARGVAPFLTNNEGIMQLICNVYLSESDKSVIERRIIDLQKEIILDIENMEDELKKDHLKCLGWMLKNGKLEIKIAVIDNTYGIQHEKIGILEDENENIISFSGSENETWMAWVANNEKFHVFRNWNPEEVPHLESDILDFNSYWNNTAFRTTVYPVNDALTKKIIEISPKNSEEFKILSKDTTEKLLENYRTTIKTDFFKKDWSPLGTNFQKFNSKNLKPWLCQKRAVDAFKKNGFNGILKMATGTGKTACALFILENYFKEIQKGGNKIMVITPSGKDGIGGQWEEFLTKNKSTNDYVYRFDSETSTEEKRHLTRIWKKELDTDSNMFVIITIQSLKNFPFNNVIPNFLIADEVHEYGTINRIDMIKRKIGNIPYKLSLSATPERYYDPEGTANILKYFGPVIFKYPIKEAQREEKYKNSETVLANYLYNVSIVNLNDEEEKRVNELTKEIGKDVAISNDPTISEKKLEISSKIERLLQRRAVYIKTAENKLKILKKILIENNKKLKNCILYCENTVQLDKAEEIFKELNMTSYVKYHSKIDSRSESLELFKEHNCDFILSINCLDQGIDIPSCQSLILLSGSTNPRQYIQRRGRVLRNYKGKPLVQIYDILAFPMEQNEGYLGLVKSQLLRAWEFIDSSQSSEEKAKLIDIHSKYNISVDELEKEIGRW